MWNWFRSWWRPPCWESPDEVDIAQDKAAARLFELRMRLQVEVPAIAADLLSSGQPAAACALLEAWFPFERRCGALAPREPTSEWLKDRVTEILRATAEERSRLRDVL